MNKTNITKFFKSFRASLIDHGPEILTGIGIAGMVTTTVLAVRATPKALSLIEKEKNQQNRKLVEEAERNNEANCTQISKLKPGDMIKVTWKCYIPAAITGVTSIACLIGASSAHSKRNAILATAYKLSESALTEYKEKVVETIGEKKEQAIQDKVYKEHIQNNPVSKTEVIITENGNTLCYDYYSGRYFRSDIDKIKKAVNELNKRLLEEDYISLNEFYNELGLSDTGLGARLGWNTSMKLIDLEFSSQLSEDGTPCLVIDYKIPPKYDFDKFW